MEYKVLCLLFSAVSLFHLTTSTLLIDPISSDFNMHIGTVLHKLPPYFSSATDYYNILFKLPKPDRSILEHDFNFQLPSVCQQEKLDMTSSNMSVALQHIFQQTCDNLRLSINSTILRHDQQKQEILRLARSFRELLPLKLTDPMPEKGKRAIIGGIGKLSNYLFGTATEDEIQHLVSTVRSLSTVVANNMKFNTMLNTSIIQSVSSITSITGNVQTFMIDTHKQLQQMTFELHSLADQLFVDNTFLTINSILNNYIIKFLHTSMTQDFLLHSLITDFSDCIQAITQAQKGFISPKIITPSLLQRKLDLVATQLAHSNLKIIHQHISFYYQQPLTTILHDKQFLYICVKVPLTFKPDLFELYYIKAMPVPADITGNGTKTAQTMLTDFSPYIAVGADFSFFELSHTDISLCKITTITDCPKFEPILLPPIMTCSLAIIKHSLSDIKKYCKFHYYPQTLRDTTVYPLSKGKFLINTQVKQWNLVCDNMAPQLFLGCRYCVYELHCQCSLTIGHVFLPPQTVSCSNITTIIPMKYPVNLATLLHFFDSEAIKHHNFSKIYDIVPEIPFPNFHITSQFNLSKAISTMDSSSIDLKTLSQQLSNENIYHTPTDALYDVVSKLHPYDAVHQSILYGLLFFVIFIFILNGYLVYKVYVLNGLLVALSPKATAFKLFTPSAPISSTTPPTNDSQLPILLNNHVISVLLTLVCLYFLLRLIQLLVVFFKHFKRNLALCYLTPMNLHMLHSNQYSLIARLNPTLESCGYSVLVTKLRICPSHIEVNSLDGKLIKTVNIEHQSCARQLLKIEWQEFNIISSNISLKSTELPNEIVLPFGFESILKSDLSNNIVFLIGRDGEFHTIPVHKRENLYPILPDCT